MSKNSRIGLLKSDLGSPETNAFGREISFPILFLEVSGTTLATPEKYSAWLQSNNRTGRLAWPLIVLMCVYMTYDGYRRKKVEAAHS